MKKVIISFMITIIVGGAIFLIINNFIGNDEQNKKEEKSNIEENSNTSVDTSKIENIDFKKYQEFMSEMYDDESFVIAITSSESDDIKSISDTYRNELAYSFKDKKISVYEIDTAKLDEKELSIVISDVSKVMKYDKPSLVTPTLLVNKKGKVKGYEGLKYSTDLEKIIEDNKIK